MVIHSGWCFVARASTAREIESFTLRSERQNFLAQGERFEQVVCGLFGGALGAVGAFEHPIQLALAELPQCAAHAQVNVEGAAVRAKWICRFVFCGHGDTCEVDLKDSTVGDEHGFANNKSGPLHMRA